MEQSAILNHIWRIITMQDYNSMVVILTTSMMGIVSGIIGVFMLLRRRSLLVNALSHASLPGIACAFIIASLLGFDGKWLPGLLFGAACFATFGLFNIDFIIRSSTLKEDTALGVVLSSYFGAGIALLGIIQNMPKAAAAGLEYFIYGKSATVLFRDAVMIIILSCIVIIIVFVLFKEFHLICFDPDYAHNLGYPVKQLDILLMILALAVMLVGLQAVGMVLILSFIVAPAISARFWTHHLRNMVFISGFIGFLSGFIGASLSAVFVQLPTGPLIVIVATIFFFFSFLFGSKNGQVLQKYEYICVTFRINVEHLLRDFFECEMCEVQNQSNSEQMVIISYEQLCHNRHWKIGMLPLILWYCIRLGYVISYTDKRYSLTKSGYYKAREITRRHLMWECYLTEYVSLTDKAAHIWSDAIEHHVDYDIILTLEAYLRERHPSLYE